MNNPEIKACPFCGGEAKLMLTTSDATIDHRHTVVCARPCGGSGQVATSPALAIEAWNNRAGDRQTTTPESTGVKALASASGYDAWLDEVKRIARLMGFVPNAIATIDKEAWKDYLDEGETPASAWLEELSNM